MEKLKKLKSEKVLEIVIIFFAFVIYFTWASTQSYNAGPDEPMKYDICKYIVQNNKLPHGGDEAVRNPMWGISYGFSPILAYMISAMFMKIAMIFTKNAFYILVSARLTSVLSATLTVFMVTKIADKLFKRCI